MSQLMNDCDTIFIDSNGIRYKVDHSGDVAKQITASLSNIRREVNTIMSFLKIDRVPIVNTDPIFSLENILSSVKNVEYYIANNKIHFFKSIDNAKLYYKFKVFWSRNRIHVLYVSHDTLNRSDFENDDQFLKELVYRGVIDMDEASHVTEIEQVTKEEFDRSYAIYITKKFGG